MKRTYKREGKREIRMLMDFNLEHAEEAARNDSVEVIYTVSPVVLRSTVHSQDCNLSPLGRSLSKLTFPFQAVTLPVPFPSASEFPGISSQGVGGML
jgi:hypothetical protein